MLFSTVIGVLSAGGAVCFRALIEMFGNLFWSPGATFTDQVVASPLWFRIVFPPAVGLVAGLLIVYIIPEAREPGVPEVILSLMVACMGSVMVVRLLFGYSVYENEADQERGEHRPGA